MENANVAYKELAAASLFRMSRRVLLPHTSLLAAFLGVMELEFFGLFAWLQFFFEN